MYRTLLWLFASDTVTHEAQSAAIKCIRNWPKILIFKIRSLIPNFTKSISKNGAHYYSRYLSHSRCPTFAGPEIIWLEVHVAECHRLPLIVVAS